MRLEEKFDEKGFDRRRIAADLVIAASSRPPDGAVVAGKLQAWRSDCAPAAGKSPLDRLEPSREIATLEAAVAYYASLGVKVERVMTDNSCYLSRAFGETCRKLGIRPIRTKPYTPKTNGKAERFIQTSLREWAYARAYDTSNQRAAELPRWLHSYNWHRPHGSIGSKPPISRIGPTGNNLLRLRS